MSPGACPRCHVALLAAHAGPLPLAGCRDCGGLWLSPAVLGRVVSTLDEAALGIAQQASAGATRAHDLERADLPCPACRQPLFRARLTGDVDVDRCAEHGTWFDRDELVHVAEALRASRRQPGRPARPAPATTTPARARSDDDDDRVDGAAVALLGAEVAAEVGVEVLADGGVEVAGSLLEGAFELLGGLFS